MGHTGGITLDGRAESAAGDAYELRYIYYISISRRPTVLDPALVNIRVYNGLVWDSDTSIVIVL